MCAISAAEQALVALLLLSQGSVHSYIPTERKPGALRDREPFSELPLPLEKRRHGLLHHHGGDRLMTRVLSAIQHPGLDAVLVAVELVIE